MILAVRGKNQDFKLAVIAVYLKFTILILCSINLISVVSREIARFFPMNEQARLGSHYILHG
jgi:hypothetical protein